MDEVLIGTQHSDQSFEIHIGASGTGLLTRASPHTAVPPVVGATISDSNDAHWVATTFCNVGHRQDVQPSPDSGRIFLPRSEVEFLTQMRRELDELTGSVQLSHGAEFCRRFIEGVGLSLSRVPRARCAVFADEENGVELVAHSRASMRQVSFEFGLEQSLINIVRIDEKMQRTEQACGIDKVRTLAEAIAWLKPH